VTRRSIGIPCSIQPNGSNGGGLTRLEAIAERRSIPGVMLFAGTGDVLFMNSEAEVLNQQISAARNEAGSQEVLPVEILDLCMSLRSLLEHEDQENSEEQHELRRVAGDLPIPVLFRGFPLAPHSRDDDACMLVLMERIGRERRIVSEQAKDQFRLTDREVEIVKYISEGWTNKEIAQHLDISEHTVKEHVRHLLKKTKSTTRTGILAQIFQDT